jgi:hypothetical protein
MATFHANLSILNPHTPPSAAVALPSPLHPQVSTYQLVVLMLFQQTDTLTYKEIAEQTGIPPGELKRALQSMSLVKVRG